PEPEPEPAPEPDPEPTEEEKYWSYVTQKFKAAHRAIASGSLIRANEITSLLRRMLIELICVRNGITENFEHSIDFIDCEEKDMLIKTYPAALDQNSLAGALGVMSELFDRLG
ncbi:MAG: hypothetical protein IJP17_00965, partial [Clostridia bacterium]|nr:hypothetical protein [Clostridia bacterium]